MPTYPPEPVPTLIPRVWSKPRKNEWGEWQALCRVGAHRYPMGDLHGESREECQTLIQCSAPLAPLLWSDELDENAAYLDAVRTLVSGDPLVSFAGQGR